MLGRAFSRGTRFDQEKVWERLQRGLGRGAIHDTFRCLAYWVGIVLRSVSLEDCWVRGLRASATTPAPHLRSCDAR